MDANGLQIALARQARSLKSLNPLALPREDFERVEVCRTPPLKDQFTKLTVLRSAMSKIATALFVVRSTACQPARLGRRASHASR
jgi:hypothetical protein